MRPLQVAGRPGEHAARPPGEGTQDIADLALGGSKAAAGVHKEMRLVPAFPRPASASRAIAANFSSVMPGAGEDARALHLRGAVTTRTASQSRSPPVSNRSGMSSTATGARAATAAVRNASRSARTSGCTIASSSFRRSGSTEHLLAERRTIDDPVRDGAGKCFRDERGGGAAIERVHDRIGVVDGNAERPEHRRGRRLAHADRAGEAEHEGHRLPSISAAIRARSAGVTVGVTPNQRAKPGTAWCSSMPRPSTARCPCARACLRSGVSSGT